MREAYQSRIDQRILTSNLLVHLNPNFRESRLHTYIHENMVNKFLRTHKRLHCKAILVQLWVRSFIENAHRHRQTACIFYIWIIMIRDVQAFCFEGGKWVVLKVWGVYLIKKKKIWWGKMRVSKFEGDKHPWAYPHSTKIMILEYVNYGHYYKILFNRHNY